MNSIFSTQFFIIIHGVNYFVPVSYGLLFHRHLTELGVQPLSAEEEVAVLESRYTEVDCLMCLLFLENVCFVWLFLNSLTVFIFLVLVIV